MSWHKHDDNCEGCKPALLNAKTGEAFPPDSPQMMAVNEAWARTLLIERRAWHRVTCQGSQLPSDLRIAQRIAQMFQDALAELPRTPTP